MSDNIAIIHSKMSDGDKYIQYQKCINKQINILVGPRSAIFAPFDNLGLVVMDECDDSSYNSEKTPRYKTLDIARYRCNIQNAMLIKLSATPTISDYYNSKTLNNINLYKLSKRVNSVLPKIVLVDMKEENKLGNKTILSNKLKELVSDRLEKNEQILIYLNKRGYNRVLTCVNCGKTYKCPNCDVGLTFHKNNKLKCHYCGLEIDNLVECPNCHSKEFLKLGIGTEQVEDLFNKNFPNAKILRMDRDAIVNKNSYDEIIENFKKHKADILIGTQMIIKGHDFENVTLVGMLNIDSSLYENEYDACEKTFSILTQCIGRSGRAKEGIAVLQGYDFDSFAIKKAIEQNYDGFYEEEIKFRKRNFYPPFSKMLISIIYSKEFDDLNLFVENAKKFLEINNNTNAIILGPTEHNPFKINNEYIYKLYIKCKSKDDAKYFRGLICNFKKARDKNDFIKLNFDILS